MLAQVAANAPNVQAYLPANYDDFLKAVVLIVLLAVFLERALALVFEHDIWQAMEAASKGKKWGVGMLKEPIALGCAWQMCTWAGFDALAALFPDRPSTHFSHLLTAMVIAGGSKGAMKLFQDVLGIKNLPAAALEQPDPAKQKQKQGE